MKRFKSILLSSLAIAAATASNMANAAGATVKGVVTNMSSTAQAVNTAIPIFATLVGSVLAFYFFILLNKKADEQRGHDVSMTKLILTAIAGGGLLAYGTSAGVFQTLLF